MRVALLQLNSSDSPQDNLPVTMDAIDRAAGTGAEFILTPEVTNCVSTSRIHQEQVLHHETDDPTLSALQEQSERLSIWLLIGSLAVKATDPDGRYANRSILIDPDGQIKARYDKIHMFDVMISDTESYRESAGYRPGSQLVTVQMPDFILGLTICYDVRFPSLFRQLAQAGAGVITAPSAFSPVTGAAHWETLLRARAIETGSYILAPAQTGVHSISTGKSRSTYGHSMIIDPWGQVLADAGTDTGMIMVDIDMDKVAKARQRIPSLCHARDFTGPA